MTSLSRPSRGTLNQPEPIRMTAANDLLMLWEAGAIARPCDRDAALLRWIGQSAALTLSRRNEALLRMREHLFGPMQTLRCNCPECGSVAEFAVNCGELAQSAVDQVEPDQIEPLDHDDYRIHFRLPNADDVAAAANSAVVPFERALLARCVERIERAGQPECTIDHLPADAIDHLSSRMEELAPGASICFTIGCPECSAEWTAPMSVGDVLWSEVQARAERLLLDVDLLARSYGWDEAGILAMNPVRRAAYLQLAGAGR